MPVAGLWRPRRTWRPTRTIDAVPASAFALLAFFVVVAIVAGVVATWLVGPRRLTAVAVPIVAAFGALYLVGHRLGMEIGPTMILFGYQVAIVQDVLVAAAAAVVAAAVQRVLLTRRAAGQGA